MVLKALVKNGRLTLDEPTELPDGSVVELTPVETADDLDDEERAALNASLRRGIDDVKAGRVHPAEEVHARIRERTRAREQTSAQS